MEILATIIIIGILAAIAIPNFTPMRENVLDKESNASLKLIQAAQKIYRLEAGFYFPYSGTESIQGTINTNLRILLPTDDSTRKWTYRCADTASGTKSCSDSTRYNKPGDTRHWRLWVNETDQLSGECP
jgi:type II secretory pathway pseudopilin PulG